LYIELRSAHDFVVIVLFEVGQNDVDEIDPFVAAASLGACVVVVREPLPRHRAGWQRAEAGLSGKYGEPELLDIVRALRPATGFPSSLHCRQQHAYQNADDGNDHQQLNQGKTGAATEFLMLLHVQGLFSMRKSTSPDHQHD
jgi:hypothetical protein